MIYLLCIFNILLTIDYWALILAFGSISRLAHIFLSNFILIWAAGYVLRLSCIFI
jgi:hypothetical protein